LSLDNNFNGYVQIIKSYQFVISCEMVENSIKLLWVENLFYGYMLELLCFIITLEILSKKRFATLKSNLPIVKWKINIKIRGKKIRSKKN
jgi:hypothetical protein